MKPNEVIIRRLKKRMKDGVESKMLSPEQYFGLIDNTIDTLLCVNGINDEAVEKFEKNIDEQLEIIKKSQEKISELYKKVYDIILSDL